MIKILFFIETLRAGGAEKVLLSLVNHMDRSRFQVSVVTPWPEDRSLLAPGVGYQSLYPSKNKLYRNLYRLEAALGTAVRRIRGKFDIEIAYLECGPTKIMAASPSIAKKIAWVHCDLTLKNDDPAAFVRQCAPWYRKFDRVVCVSEAVRESYRKLFGDTPPVSVLYNVNDESEILTKADAFVPEQAGVPTLCAVGRLSQEKGFDRLILACARLKEEGIPFRLQLIGEGDQRPQLEALIGQEGLGGHVQLLGWQSNPYPYMKAADVIVCSSRYEGLSTVVTEALILGKAVVTTPCTGMTELLGPSESGLITEDLRSGLKQMLTEPGLRKRYAAAAARRGLDFRKDALLAETEQFFTETLEGT